MELMKTLGLSNGSPDTATLPPSADQGGGGLPKSLEGVIAKHRGVKPGTKRGPYGKGKTPEAAAGSSAPVAPPPVPLFTEANTKLVVSLPFKLAFARTGFDGFLLTPLEEEMLCSTGVNVFNQWVAIDPKYVSLSLFSLALLSIAGEKMMLYRAFQREVADKNKSANGGKAPDAINGEKSVS